jgi:bifunctional non-homologous end joining protein LigD
MRLQLVSTCPEIPDGDGWLHEMKHDGHHPVAIVTPDTLKLISRKGYDRTALFCEPIPVQLVPVQLSPRPALY